MAPALEIIDLLDDEEENIYISDDEEPGYQASDFWDSLEDEEKDPAAQQRLLEQFRQAIIKDEPQESPSTPRPKVPERNLPIAPPFAQLQYARIPGGVNVQPGDTVELLPEKELPPGRHSGSFLRISAIFQDCRTDDKIFFRGHIFRRTKYMASPKRDREVQEHVFHSANVYPKKMNELVMVLNIDEDDDRPAFVQAMEDIPIDRIVRKRNMIMTNTDYPNLSFTQDHSSLANINLTEDKDDNLMKIFHRGRLICRYVESIYWDNATHRRRQSKSYSGEIRRLYHKEADHGTESGFPSMGNEGNQNQPISVDDNDNPRELKTVFTSLKAKNIVVKRQPSIELISSGPKRSRAAFGRKSSKYRFFDIFSGGGATSDGAEMAGFRVQLALDFNKNACETYQLNHPGVQCLKMAAQLFPPNGFDPQNPRADLCHLSFPCPFVARPHTRTGKDDQANYDILFLVGHLLRQIKPRVATIEESDGLIAIHKDIMKSMFCLIREAGYDFKWKVMNTADFGVAQRRKRLIIIMARRGTPLPPFPKPTHGVPGSGLKRFKSIWDALEPLRLDPARDDYYHNPEAKARLYKEPYDPKTKILPTITCNGGDNWHYDGRRNFTVREFAYLQDFRIGFHLTGSLTEALRVVGNAWPPTMAKAVFEQVRHTLEAFDGGKIGGEDTLLPFDVEESDIQELRLFLHSKTKNRQDPISIDSSDEEVNPPSFPSSPSSRVKSERRLFGGSITPRLKCRLPNRTFGSRRTFRSQSRPGHSPTQCSRSDPPTPSSSQTSGYGSSSSISPLKGLGLIDLTDDSPPAPRKSQSSSSASSSPLSDQRSFQSSLMTRTPSRIPSRAPFSPWATATNRPALPLAPSTNGYMGSSSIRDPVGRPHIGSAKEPSTLSKSTSRHGASSYLLKATEHVDLTKD
ncbi:S-adenosyl-L-methionine-dependent methyltransferase [Lophium mytilinum]|uniref:DNA (cytosine-5-)-methyltransferase n=1 Tax=Lophium mytilinum TaxID=390894 RepID=A0A6A6R3L9_9PEZI|nr:S-adenosyl-L-methionine-dependent methyltransferase [Lophium mytilinum]